MNAGAVAMPVVSVATVAVLTPPAKVPLAPVVGAVKVIEIAGIAFPKASVTFASSAVANISPGFAVCPEPAKAMMDEAGPAETLKVCVAVSNGCWISVTVRVCVPLVLSVTEKT